MKKRILSLILALAMCLPMVPTVPALAAGEDTQPVFSDVPTTHWAYDVIMEMVRVGVVNGIGGGKFAPSEPVSPAMFITLIGRVLFPDITKEEGADWYKPFVTALRKDGLLEGTTITDDTIEGEISRYDMAVILVRSSKILGIPAIKANRSQVTDYSTIPSQYTDAVLVAYGSGLLGGDQNGRFNGSDSMTRAEAAAVMSRLITLEKEAKSREPAQENPLPPTPDEKPEPNPEPKPDPKPETKPETKPEPEPKPDPSATAQAANEAWVDEQLKKIIQDGMSEKEKATAIAKFICDYMVYDFSDYWHHTPTVTIKEGDPKYSEPYGVCHHYAVRYQAFCRQAGLTCEYISGEANNKVDEATIIVKKDMNRGEWEGHAWNRVKCDGAWYYVDTCWMDGGSGKYEVNGVYDMFYCLAEGLWYNHREDDGTIGTETEYDWDASVNFAFDSGVTEVEASVGDYICLLAGDNVAGSFHFEYQDGVKVTWDIGVKSECRYSTALHFTITAPGTFILTSESKTGEPVKLILTAK